MYMETIPEDAHFHQYCNAYENAHLHLQFAMQMVAIMGALQPNELCSTDVYQFCMRVPNLAKESMHKESHAGVIVCVKLFCWIRGHIFTK